MTRPTIGTAATFSFLLFVQSTLAIDATRGEPVIANGVEATAATTATNVPSRTTAAAESPASTDDAADETEAPDAALALVDDFEGPPNPPADTTPAEDISDEDPNLEGKALLPAHDQTWGALVILGEEVEPGSRKRLKWAASQSFAGGAVKTPVEVIRGHRPGPTLCLTAAVHGDELNGVEIVRRVLADTGANELSGTIIGTPIVNLLGFSQGSRYLPDRRDLNRYFPGNTTGSSASRIAHVFFNEIVRQCEYLVDFHTGSFKRTNLPQLRADMDIAAVREFVTHFGATAVLHKTGQRGTLRDAASAAGIPAVAFELGEPGTLQLDAVAFGIKAIDSLLDKLYMLDRFRLWSEPQPTFYRSRWLRAYDGGILSSSMEVGARVRKRQILGTVTNPVTNRESKIRSPFAGRLLGRALNQFVLPGFATFHIGIETLKEPARDHQSPLQSTEVGKIELDLDLDLDLDDDQARVPQTLERGAEMAPVADDRIDDIDEEMH